LKVTRHRNAIPGPRVGRGAGGAMTPSQMACGLAVLAVVCVLAVFFFPGHAGTVFRGSRASYCEASGRRSRRVADGRRPGGADLGPTPGQRGTRPAAWCGGAGAEFQSSALATGAGITLGC
jgi:hypothetical protein